jgi:hypothetical protein
MPTINALACLACWISMAQGILVPVFVFRFFMFLLHWWILCTWSRRCCEYSYTCGLPCFVMCSRDVAVAVVGRRVASVVGVATIVGCGAASIAVTPHSFASNNSLCYASQESIMHVISTICLLLELCGHLLSWFSYIILQMFKSCTSLFVTYLTMRRVLFLV